MINYEQCKETNADYTNSNNMLKRLRLLTSSPDTPDKLKGMVAGAAIHHFSNLSHQKQFEILAEYFKKIEVLAANKAAGIV